MTSRRIGWVPRDPIGWLDRHRAVLLSTLVFLFVFGAAFAVQIPVDRMATAEAARIEVHARLPGFDAVTIQTRITEPLERALTAVDGLKSVVSRSARGHAAVVLHFSTPPARYGTVEDVQRRLAQSAAGLPPGVETRVTLDPAARPPAVIYTVTAPRLSREVMRWVNDILVDPLRELTEVSTVSTANAQRRQIRIEPQSTRLASLGLGFDAVIAALRGSEEAPRGNTRRAALSGDGIDAVMAQAVQLPSREPIPLGEVASVSFAGVPAAAHLREGGPRTVRVSIYAGSDEDAVGVAERANAHLAWLRANEVVPSDVSIRTAYDRAAAAQAWRKQVVQRTTSAILLILGVGLFVFGAAPSGLAAAAFAVWLAVTTALLWYFDFVLDARAGTGMVLAFAPFAALLFLPPSRFAVVVLAATLGLALLASQILDNTWHAAAVIAIASAVGLIVRALMTPWLRPLFRGDVRGRGAAGARLRPVALSSTALVFLAIAIATANALSDGDSDAPEGRFRLLILGANRGALAEQAENVLPSLRAIARVSSVESSSKRVEGWRLHLDDARMAAAGVMLAEVGRAFAIATEGLVVGEVVSAERRIPVRLQLAPGAAGESFERLLLRGERENHPAVYLRHIGFVERIFEPMELLQVNGTPAVEVLARWRGAAARKALERFCWRMKAREDFDSECSFSSALYQ